MSSASASSASGTEQLVKAIATALGIIFLGACRLACNSFWDSTKSPAQNSTHLIPDFRQKLAVAAIPAASQEYLTRAQLPLASAMVGTQWKAWRPGSGSYFWQATPDADYAATGSAGVVYVGQDGVVSLITNRHVLCLDELMAAKANGGLAIKNYSVQVKFPSGKICNVFGVGHDRSNVDLAYLFLDGHDLRPGIDYVVLPVPPAGHEPHVGDEVVAIGNPGIGTVNFENTQTFGHISAIRPEEGYGRRVNLVQTDAAINHGNSGGPLMLKSGEQYCWIGVNTFAIGREQGYNGINFAIDSPTAMDLDHIDFSATPQGIATLLTKLYSFPVGVYQPQ